MTQKKKDDETPKPQPQRLMTQPERNSLVKVIRERFKVFRRHAKVTRDELRVQIFERVQAENERKIEAARKDMAKIEERARKLQEDAKAVVAKHRANGLRVGGAKVEDKWFFSDADGKRQEMRKAVTVWTTDAPVTISVSNGWVVEGIERQVEREYRKLEREYGLGELAMAKREQELVEEVILGGVQSSEAQAFLGRVPTLDNLPEAQEVVKELHA